MTFRSLLYFVIAGSITIYASGCKVLSQSAKYEFNDGVYRTERFGGSKVYVMTTVDEDTITVFPIQKFKDSSAIVTNKRMDYTPMQRRFKDNKTQHTFYKPSFDVDVMTIPMKYRPAVLYMPNQLTTTFNGALYGGYRIDAYSVKYKRTPLNIYKQKVKHLGYSAGLFAGIGNTFVDNNTLVDTALSLQYEGVLLISGIAANVAVENLNFGLAFGFDHLLDKFHDKWIYQGKPCIGFTLGLNIN